MYKEWKTTESLNKFRKTIHEKGEILEDQGRDSGATFSS